MTSRAFLDTLDGLQVWVQGDRRAAHKPLLLLLMLGCMRQHNEPRKPFLWIRARFEKLFRDFGPKRTHYNAHYPFGRLCNDDDIWEIENVHLIGLTDAGDLLMSDLRKHNPSGGFTDPVAELMRRHPELIDAAATLLLNKHSPESYHQDILAAVGLIPQEGGTREDDNPVWLGEEWFAPVERILRAQRMHCLNLRMKVLPIYGNQCAICGYDVCLDDASFGIGAMHIQWHMYGGPDQISNGLALCSIHHHAMDRGAITLDEELNVLVADATRGGGNTWHALFERFKNKPLEGLLDKPLRPQQEFLQWHREEVYKGDTGEASPTP